MTWRLPLLPLAPRPLPGEGVLSWVRRVAARYDLDAPGLIAVLCPPGVRVHPSRVMALDCTGEHGLDRVLAAAARLEPGRIAAMRIVTGGPARAALLHRFGPVWCDLCMRDDVARHGEVHERAVWRLGWCLACAVHGCRLSEVCPSCLMSGCDFRVASGRVRLVCSLCRSPVDAMEPAKGWQPYKAVAARLAMQVAPKVDATVLALQEALLTASTDGTAPSGSLSFGLDAEAFLSAIHSLAVPFAWPLRSQQDLGAGSAHDLDVPGALPISVLHRCLGVLATVLAEAADVITGPAAATATTLARGETSGQLASLLDRFGARDREELRRRALAWGPTFGPLVLGILDEQDDCARRAAEVVAQSRQVARVAAAELRRIRARRARRAALARLRQKYEGRRL